MTDTTANRPSHRLFNVTGDGDNARWGGVTSRLEIRLEFGL